jgi:predicted lipoprotein with Yx(FWY)xxD motif
MVHSSIRGKRWQLGIAAFAALTLAAGLAALQFSSPAKADSSSCGSTLTTTTAPTGPATVSAETKAPYGKVLVIGGGPYDGCSLYLLTSDQLHSLTGAHYACDDSFNAIGQPCDTFLWPALLTDGTPIAGPGVKQKLLGTVTRTDIPGLGAVQQVTYAGMPLYRFFLDESSDETDGANLFDPVTSPTGTWYLVNPRNGNPATGPAEIGLETAPDASTGQNRTVLAATMDQNLSAFFTSGAPFPVYTSSLGGGHDDDDVGDGRGAHCDAICAQTWQPVLTSGAPQAGAGVNQHWLGTRTRGDGTQQVTYKGHLLYLFADDAYLPTLPYNGGAASINGDGARTVWGTFNTIP